MNGKIVSRKSRNVQRDDRDPVIEREFDRLVAHGLKIIRSDPEHSERRMRHRLAAETGLSVMYVAAASCVAAAMHEAELSA